jgi:hypothetical protein
MEYECTVVSLFYIQQFAYLSGGDFFYTSMNWKAVVLTAMLLANKMWDDFHMMNSDYTYLFPGVTLERINELEVAFLERMGHSLFVSRSNYTKVHYVIQAILAKDEISKHAASPAPAAGSTVPEQRKQDPSDTAASRPQILGSREGMGMESKTDTSVSDRLVGSGHAPFHPSLLTDEELPLCAEEEEGAPGHMSRGDVSRESGGDGLRGRARTASWEAAAAAPDSMGPALAEYVEDKPRKRNLGRVGAEVVKASTCCFCFTLRVSVSDEDVI